MAFLQSSLSQVPSPCLAIMALVRSSAFRFFFPAYSATILIHLFRQSFNCDFAHAMSPFAKQPYFRVRFVTKWNISPVNFQHKSFLSGLNLNVRTFFWVPDNLTESRPECLPDHQHAR